MAFKTTLVCLILAVVYANAGLLNFGSSLIPGTAPQPRGFFGGLLNKTSDIIGNVKDNVNKITDDTTNMITNVADEAKNFLSGLEKNSFCKCSGLTCSCCADGSLMKMQNKFCVKLGVILTDMAIRLSAEFNEKTLFSTQVTGKNPPPICAPIGPVPAITICVRPYDLSLGVTGFRVCLQLEAAAFGKTVATAAFNCFRINSQGTLTMETTDENPNKGYVNLNVSSILPYIPESMKVLPMQLPVYPISLLTGK